MREKLKYFWGYFFAFIYGFPYRKLKMVGITGTDGKTTTSTILYSLLKEQKRKVAVMSTISCLYFDGETETEVSSYWNRYDMPIVEIMRLPFTHRYNEGQHVTTAWAPTIQHILAVLAKRGCEIVVLESTSHALSQQRLAGLQFDLVGITNISHEHLDYHKTMENYLNAKAMIFKTEKWLPQKRYMQKRYGFVNADDRNSEGFYNKAGKFELRTYSLQDRGDFNAKIMELTLDGSKFEYGGKLLSQSLVGEYNIYNCFLALLLYERLGHDVESAVNAVQKLRSPRGRFEIFKTVSHGCVIVDFAHTPQSYERLLQFARKNIHGRIIVVFGSAGLRDKTKRPLMGETAARYADVLIITSEDPRTEKAADIGRAIIEGAKGAGFNAYMENGRTEKVYYEEYDRKKAIMLAVIMSQQGDYVFVLGKGHEESMCYGSEEQPWSDQLVVGEVIASVETVV